MVEQTRINENLNLIEDVTADIRFGIYKLQGYACTYTGCVHQIIPIVLPLMFSIGSFSGALGALLSFD